MDKKDESKNLKYFFIKLVSISFAIIIILNILFNLAISNIKYADILLNLDDRDVRRVQADKLRNELNNLLTKDEIIKKEDKILLYKFYQKLKSEFKDLE